jgi:ABC-2 type transport system permease protein
VTIIEHESPLMHNGVVATTQSLARTMLRLKLTILRNGIIGSRTRTIMASLALAFSFIGATVGAVRLAQRASDPPAAALESLTLGLAMLFGLWVFGPLLVGGVDDSLDPTRLALLPLRRSELRKGLLIGAVVGPLPLATTVTLLGVFVGFAPRSPAAVLTGVAVLVALLLNIGMSRALSVALAFSGRSRRGKDLSVLLASLGAAALFLGTQSLRFLSSDDKRRVLRALRWLPAGQLAVAIQEVHVGRFAPAVVRIAAIALMAFVCFRLWLSGVDRLLVDPDAIRHQRGAASRDVTAIVPRPLRRWGQRPVVVLASKELRYLARSPQRRSSLIISIVIGTVFALLQSMRYANANPSSVFGAAVAALFGVHATNNVLGTDASSLWMEQTAGARLRDQLSARSLAAAPNLVIPTILAAGVLAAMSGGWSEFMLVSICALTFIGVAMGVGVVVSVVAPFNQPDVGNPYSNKRVTTGQGGLVSLLAVVGIVSLMVISLPPTVVIGVGWFAGRSDIVVGGVLFSAVYSWATWRLGLRLAMRIIGDREVDLLSRLGGRRSNT